MRTNSSDFKKNFRAWKSQKKRIGLRKYIALNKHSGAKVARALKVADQEMFCF
jgi:hypothetical protein